MAETTDLQARARALAELLRPHPHRGDLIGAGAVPLTVALLLVNVRLDASWGTGIFLVLTGLACALVLAMGVLAPLEREQPRSYQVVLQLCGLVLLFVALLRLAQVLGVDEPLDSAGASFWMLAVVACAAAWLARERRSAICTLVAAVAGTFALLSFVSWVFSPDGPATSRWVLLFVALGLLVGALLLRDRHRTESVYLIDAAGFAVLAIGLTYVGSLLFGFAVFERSDGLVRGLFDGPGAWWKLVILAGGLGLVAYAGVDRQPGPGWLGVLNLLVFVVLVGQPGEGGASLWFWPMILLLVGGAMIAAGLRPREPLPPEPGRADPAPVVPVTPASPPSPPPSASPPAADPPAESPPAAASGPEQAPRSASAPEQAPGAASGPEHASGAASAPDRPGAASPPGSAPAWDRPPAPAPGPEQPPNGAAAPDRSPEPPAASPPAEPAEPAARPEPEPPARGSLWARADPGEQPTKPHRRPPSAGDDDA
ncbi:hypothetical protein [Conexibacter arvalis]|uniref:Putative membrane protein n=1 Tax=Conexibacter arvalis TaxID=912552 RepID=A0A840IGD3_9ACTN|nr:hypothetical protein [Conexibacter arvalis]MBB4664097.1 putative membrane protein [Conexibacter arvalis]